MLAPWKKSYGQLSILKSRDITLPTKVHLVKGMVFPAVMYVCESWTTKKGEHWRIYAFELWYRRRLLRVPWTARRSNQSILKEISHWRTDAEAKIPILWPSDVKNWLIWKDPDAGKDWRRGDRGWDGWMASPAWWTWVWASSWSWWSTEKPGMLQSMGSQSQTKLRDWLNWLMIWLNIHNLANNTFLQHSNDNSVIEVTSLSSSSQSNWHPHQTPWNFT